MDWLQFGMFFLSTAGMFLWSRSESRSDIHSLRQEFNSLRQEVKEESRILRQEVKEEIKSLTSDIKVLVRVINEEMRDFHGRLCSLEERRKQRCVSESGEPKRARKKKESE